MEIRKPKIVNFVSGKGGVGKTMVSVAFAYEMARQNDVILFDLDFFNRGLTGLLRKGEKVCEIARPAFLSETSSETAGSWCLFRVAPRLYHVQYPDLTEDEVRSLETLSIDDLSTKLREYLDYLAPQVKAEVIILDCHGGPDSLSFAACAVANPSILISEPDKITFYGTMHFVRQLESSCGPDSTKNLHLVFNKVIPAFSVPYLTRFYDLKLRKLFSEKPLLSVIPLEVYLTKEFERVPFITSVFPYSELAKKVRLMTWDLFHESNSQILSRSARHLNRFDRLATRYALGKKLSLVNTDEIMAIIAVFALICVAGFHSYTSTQSDLTTLGYSAVRIRIYETALSNPSHAPKICIGLHENDPEAIAECTLKACSASVYPTNRSGKLMLTTSRPEMYGDPGPDPCAYEFSNVPINETVQEAADEVRSVDARTLSSILGTEGFAIQVPSWASLQLYILADNWFTVTAFSLALWFAFALIINWTSALDRVFTYSCRAHNITASILCALCVASLWFLCSFYYLLTSDMLDNAPIWLVGLGYIPAAITASNQLYRAFKQVVGERLVIEASMRFVFAILLIAQPFAVIHWQQAFGFGR